MKVRLSYICILLYLCSVVCTSYCGEPMRCNGYEEFCDRRYNEIAQINSHNATSYASSPVQNQDRTIPQQLADGIRVFKLPIHFDYVRRADYYADLIEVHIRMLNEKIDEIEQSIIHNKRKVFDTIESKKNEVDSLQNLIQDSDNRIRELKDWYKNLPDISFEDPSSKTTRAVDYAARLSAFTVEKKTLEASRIVAKGVLEAAKRTAHVALENDPRILALKAQRFLAEKTLRAIKKEGKREVFACHTLAKRELYGDYVNRIINDAPESIRPVVKVFLTPLSLLERGSIRFLFGTSSEGGGLIPYPTCLLDKSATPLKNFLEEIKKFIEQNPHEVITILLNDFTYDPGKIAQTFEEVGLMPFVHAQDRSKPWPTFRELIENGTRLVVFSDNDYDQKLYPWLNYRNYYNAWDGGYDFKTTDVFTNPKTPLDRFGKFTFRDDKYPQNMLLDITHAVTPGLAGSKSDAAAINRISVFRPHMRRIARAAQHIPNFISIDFYEYPRKIGAQRGDVFDVIDELNGVGKYKDRPLWKPLESN